MIYEERRSLQRTERSLQKSSINRADRWARRFHTFSSLPFWLYFWGIALIWFYVSGARKKINSFFSASPLSYFPINALPCSGDCAIDNEYLIATRWSAYLLNMFRSGELIDISRFLSQHRVFAHLHSGINHRAYPFHGFYAYYPLCTSRKLIIKENMS